jgi:hypothetical protein
MQTVWVVYSLRDGQIREVWYVDPLKVRSGIGSDLSVARFDIPLSQSHSLVGMKIVGGRLVSPMLTGL